MTGAVTCRMMADGTFWLIPDIPNSTVFESLDILSNQIRYFIHTLSILNCNVDKYVIPKYIFIVRVD